MIEETLNKFSNHTTPSTVKKNIFLFFSFLLTKKKDCD